MFEIYTSWRKSPWVTDNLSRLGLSYLGPLVYLLQKTFELFGFPIFKYERTLWWLFQKHVVRTKQDIYVYR